MDFNRGAAKSRGGKAIIALPSTAKGGTVSRITTHLSPGAGVANSPSLTRVAARSVRTWNSSCRVAPSLLLPTCKLR